MDGEDIDDNEICPECGAKLYTASFPDRTEKDCYHCGTVEIIPIEE